MLPKRERCRLRDMRDERANNSAGETRESFEVRADRGGVEADEQSGDEIYINRDTAIDGHWFICRGTVTERQTPFQKVEILELSKFGRALVLDGELQSVEFDEYAYHEALVHPAMCLHPCPRHVLIIGGGEGAVAREVLKHAGVERAVMVDIDGEVVALAHEHLRSWHRGVFADPRLRLIIGDGYEFVHGTDERFDVVFIDLVSSLDGGPAEALYTRSFYETLKYRLPPGGVVVVQATECNTGLYRDHVRIRRNLEGVFAHMRSYAAFIPSYECPWGFIIASDKTDAGAVLPHTIDRVIAERSLAGRLRFYDGKTHQGLFSLPKDLRKLIGET